MGYSGRLGKGQFRRLDRQRTLIYANIVFSFSNYPELVGSKGSLISLPTRHIVIIYPINDLNVVNALNTQIHVTNGVSSKGPGTLSNSLFWYFNGELKESHRKLKMEN